MSSSNHMTSSSTSAPVGSIAPAASTMVVTEVTGSHVITINGYSRTKRLRYGEFFSHTFMAAGHRWSLRYYPNGSDDSYNESSQKWVSMYLHLDRSYNTTDVKARFTISLLDWYGQAVPSYTYASQWIDRFTPSGEHKGFPRFVKRKALEYPTLFLPTLLLADCFKVRCDITVVTDTIVPPASTVVIVPPANVIAVSKKEAKKEEDAPPESFVVVPPPDMHQHLAHLLSSGEGADVTLEVDGETFRAHRSILAARSPVFKAELLSPMEEGTSAACCVSIKDITARVFKALLHFTYTDSLPNIDEGAAMDMVQQLLTAADKYGLKRLKLICENKLCNYIGTTSVGTILALAEQHGCEGLKKACLKFLMSGSNLKAAIETDGFDHLVNNCPSVLKVLLSKVVL
ncbi:unnamed protein product [Urochloa decumbens]|uniref:Uncharacterized protein n=1 Tax=Urochloa decumbens TaxID=240449 RepID=A0ABC9AT92_9POAL